MKIQVQLFAIMNNKQHHVTFIRLFPNDVDSKKLSLELMCRIDFIADMGLTDKQTRVRVRFRCPI